MKRITLILIGILFSIASYAQQQYDHDFTQSRFLKVSGKTIQKAGHLVFDGNDQLSMTYSNPEGEYFVIEGKQVKMNLDGKKAELDAEKVKKVQLQRSTLLNCLSGHWEQAAIDNNAESTVTEKNGLRSIVLKAKEKVARGGYASVELTYRITDGTLLKMILEDATGNINDYEIQ